VLDYHKHQIDPKDYPSATELSLIAIELSKSTNNGDSSLDTTTIKKSLALWEKSHMILQEQIIARTEKTRILNEKFGEVPQWPDSQRANITHDQFKQLIGKNIPDEVFGKALLYHHFLMLHFPEWFIQNVIGFEALGLIFDKLNGTVKYSTLSKLAIENDIQENFKELYAIYLFVEAQKSEVKYLEQDPSSLDLSLFNEVNLLTTKAQVTQLSKHGCDKINHEITFTSVFYFVRFYNEMIKHLGRSSRTIKKQNK